MAAYRTCPARISCTDAAGLPRATAMMTAPVSHPEPYGIMSNPIVPGVGLSTLAVRVVNPRDGLSACGVGFSTRREGSRCFIDATVATTDSHIELWSSPPMCRPEELFRRRDGNFPRVLLIVLLKMLANSLRRCCQVV
jgi:hypothetical protein